MSDIKTCAGCGIPEAFANLHRWLTNGDIVQSTNEQARMAFVECENIDPVFRDIGRAIGVSIDHLVINIVARGTQLYMDTIVPEQVKELIRNKSMDVRSFSQGVMDLCHAIGYGKYEFLDYRYENDSEDFCRIRITRPFSILETSGAFAGVIASTVGGEHSVTYEETAPGVFELTTGWTTYPEVLKEKLELNLYRPEKGDLELEKCDVCGTPLELTRMCSWDLENGIITNPGTGLRFAVLGPGLMDTVFEALEWELGEEIPRLVVDAQRRYTREGFAPLDLSLGLERLRTQFALRGLGNLRELEVSRKGASLRLENSCMCLLLVGMLQGTFERAYGKDSSVDFEVDDKGTLRVEVKG